MATFAKVLIYNHRLGSMLGKVPALAKAYHDKVWRRRVDVVFGVYDTYEQAKAAVPQGVVSGWDSNALADHMSGSLTTDQPSVYPTLFWLKKLLTEGATVVDLGGCLGQVYHTYRQRDALPAGVTWTVVDVPAMVEKGNKLLQTVDAPGLRFEADMARIDRCDVLLSAGCLQYMETPIGVILDQMAARPRHLLLNKLPLTKGSAYWTVQNLGHTASPYRIFNEDSLLSELKQAGYALRDRWKVPDLSIEVPFHPDRRVPHFDGLYLDRAG